MFTENVIYLVYNLLNLFQFKCLIVFWSLQPSKHFIELWPVVASQLFVKQVRLVLTDNDERTDVMSVHILKILKEPESKWLSFAYKLFKNIKKHMHALAVLPLILNPVLVWKPL